MTLSDPPKPAKSAVRWTLVFVASAIGIGAGGYAGANVVAPGISGGIVFWLLKRMNVVKTPLVGAIVAVQAGHIIWQWLGAAFERVGFAYVAEVAAYTLVLLLFVWKQTKWPLVLLMAYQAFGVLINGVQLIQAPFDSATSHALTAHLVIRVCAFFLMVQFLREKPKENLVEVF
jgi:hypothetical protein